jgi:hypothetical protein
MRAYVRDLSHFVFLNLLQVSIKFILFVGVKLNALKCVLRARNLADTNAQIKSVQHLAVMNVSCAW